MDDRRRAQYITIFDRALAFTVLPLLPRWVTPNHITIFRFLTVPFLLLLLTTGEYGWGFALFAISAFSDALDGALARTTDQITDWGKMFDPLADKILIGSTVALLVPKILGLQLALIIISVELFIVLYAYYRKHYRGATIEAKKAGKAKMILQSVGIGGLFLHILFGAQIFLSIAIMGLYLSIAFALISLVVYRSA